MLGESIVTVAIEGEEMANDEQIVQLEERVKQLEHKVRTLKDRNKILGEHLEESEQKLEVFRKSVDAETELKREVERLKFENRKKEEELQRLSEQLETLERSNDALKKNNRGYESRMREMEAVSSSSGCESIGKHEGFRERVVELEEQLQEMTRIANHNRKEADECRSEIAASFALYNEAERRIKALENEKELLESRGIGDQTSLLNEIAQSSSVLASTQIPTPPVSPMVTLKNEPAEPETPVLEISISAKEPTLVDEPETPQRTFRESGPRLDLMALAPPMPDQTTSNRRHKTRTCIRMFVSIMLLIFVAYCFYLHPLQMIIDATKLDEIYDRYQYV